MRRYLPGFHYSQPNSFAEMLDLLDSSPDENHRLLAGGTDLLVAMRMKGLSPAHVISFKNLAEGMSAIAFDHGSGALRIGALATIRAIQGSADVREKFPLLAEAASVHSFHQIRNRATIGGNICNASPAADMVPPLMVLDARLLVSSRVGSREIPLDGFFVGPGRTVLSPSEVVTAVAVPVPGGAWGGSFLKVANGAEGLSVVNVATLVKLEGDRVAEARVAVGSVAPTAVRSPGAERAVVGMRVSDALPDSIDPVIKDISPITDVRAGAAYRGRLARLLVARSLRLSIARAARL